MPNFAIESRRLAAACRSRSLLGLVAGLSLIAGPTGCSKSGSSDARLRSLVVEPELPTATTSADPWRHPAGVPDVIPPPRPFRVADFQTTTDLAVRPATLAATLPPQPVAPAGFPQGVVRPVSAAEPIPAPATLLPDDGPLATGDASLVAEIRAMLAEYLRGFNRHDASAVAAHWTRDGQSLNLDSGELTAGREAVRDVFATLFEVDADVALDFELTSIRPVRADVALVDGLARIGSGQGPVVASRFSAVMVREDGTWLLDSIREAATQAVAAPSRPLDELAWLVGFWEDEGDGVTAGTRCDWTPGKGFLMRSHVIAPDAAPAVLPQAGDERIPGLLPAGSTTKSELTELIGWDPDRQAIRSWIFTADGRFAEGTWQREGADWIVLVEGRGADTGRDARWTLRPDGPDGLVVQASGDALEGLAPPACGFTRTAR